MVTAAAVVVVAGIGVLVYQSIPEKPPVRADPAPIPIFPSIPPSTGPSYLKLPNPCTIPDGAVPADVRSVAPRHIADSCRWEMLRRDRARQLDVELTLKTDDDILGSGVARAAEQYDDDVAYAADEKQNSGYESRPEPLPGLADTAFAAHATNLVISGPTERSAIAYEFGGAKVEARSRNIVISVSWQGADYPAHGGRRLTGKNLAYGTAEKQAVTVLKAVLTSLR
jgi:hypothetical protein